MSLSTARLSRHVFEYLDRRAADVLVLVLDELEHGVHDARPADARERVGARERTHQSSSAIASSRYLMLCVVPISFRISTAARRLNSFSAFSAAIRYFAVSGSLRWMMTSTALFMTSRSGSSNSSRSTRCRRGLRCGRCPGAPRRGRACSVPQASCSALFTSGRSKRASTLIKCILTTGSLPSMRVKQVRDHLFGRDLVDELEDRRLLARLAGGRSGRAVGGR